jgi:signal transduction histidine kinase
MPERGEANPGGTIENGRTLRTLFDMLPIGVAIAHDSCCEHVELNAAAAKILGVPHGEILDFTGERSKSLAFRALREGKAVPVRELPLCQVARSGLKQHGIELEVLRSDQTTVHVYIYASPLFNDRGEIAGCVDVMVDVTDYKNLLQDRKQLGERFAVSLDTMPEPFGVFTAVRDDAGTIVDFIIDYINLPGAMTNRRPREEQMGARLLDVTPAVKETGVFDAYVELVKTGVPLHREFMYQAEGGALAYYECRGNRLSDGLVALWRETTDRHRSENVLRDNEARLRQLNETLEERVRERTAEANLRADQLRDLALDLAESESRERKRFAQLLHDNFQQLVSAAKLRAGIIRRRAETDELKEAIQQIEQLLVQALDSSRNLASQLSPPVLHDAGLVPALESIVRSTEREHGLRVQFVGDPAAEPKTEPIRLILFEATRELILNTVQHSGAKTARVEVRVERTPAPVIHVVVSDDGKGFDIDNANRIHNQDKPFVMLRIQERIRYMKGDVIITSQPGQGATIELIVPSELRQEPGRRTATTATPRANPPPASSGADGRVLRIVVADDHRLFREGLIGLLSHEPHLKIVGEAADGEQAVQLTRQLQPDVLICDISMPKRSGVEVTRILSHELPGMKIVGLSMHEREDMANAMRAAGAAAYLTKSGPSDLLLGILRTFVMPTVD